MKKVLFSIIAIVFAAFTMVSCEDVPAPYDRPGEGGGNEPEVTAQGDGTAANPYNITAINEVAGQLEQGATSDKVYYFKGKVSQIKEISASFGNATFYLSDDGTTKNQFYVYRANGLNNQKVTDENFLKLGDEVVVCGKVTNYNGTLETVQKESYVVSVNGAGNDDPTPQPAGEAKGSGTEADPFNVAAAINKCQETGETATADQYYVTGIVKSVDESGISGYGNINIDMVDEGSDAVFKAFQIYSFNGQKFTGATGIKAGDVVVVKGNLVNYKGNTPETTGKGAGCLVSVNGKTELNPTPEPDPEPDPTPTPQGSNILSNGGFETWAGDVPTGWKSASTASSATLVQSTDAHTGTYSVIVKGDEASNKRLASAEMTLEAGTYEFTFYVKATDALAQVRPGYVPVTDGKVGSYAYGDYATISTSWGAVTYTFELKATTTICLVVMNPKKSSYSAGKDVLIDDAVLIKK